jgi:hypothetical protein
VLDFLATMGAGALGGTVVSVSSYFVQKSRKRHKIRYLATQLAYLFEGYVIECANNLASYDMLKISKGIFGSKIAEIPDFPELPESGVYEFIEPQLTERIFSFPQHLRLLQAKAGIYTPDQSDDSFFQANHEYTLECAELAYSIAGVIRSEHKLPSRELKHEDWLIREQLIRDRASLDEVKNKRKNPAINIEKENTLAKKHEKEIMSDNVKPTFEVTLGKAYWSQGFFNVGVSYEKYFGEHGKAIDIYLENMDQPVRGLINRTVNTNDTPRIMGGVKVKEWIQRNARRGGTIKVTVLSPIRIRLS